MNKERNTHLTSSSPANDMVTQDHEDENIAYECQELEIMSPPSHHESQDQETRGIQISYLELGELSPPSHERVQCLSGTGEANPPSKYHSIIYEDIV
jgi:hypothetical protein